MWKPCCLWPDLPGSKRSPTAHQAGNGPSQLQPSMPPCRVTVEVKRDAACSSKPPRSLPPPPAPAWHCWTPSPFAALPAAKVSCDPRQGFSQAFQRTSGPPTDRMSGVSSGPQHGKGTILDQGPGVTGENCGGAGVQRHSCPALQLIPREDTEQSPLGHGRAMSGLPQHLHSPSQLLSCLLLACPGQSSAPSAVWAGLNQPGSEAGYQQLRPEAELQLLVLSGPAASTMWPIITPGPLTGGG